ncbi:Sec1-like protein [Piromyces finnis]|uniref:Sec1-like protein n=1 Tax=Piromyces finnis TaxID=1754191 RepID=A0A1Y1V2Y2_9FUNG|nr:Sec1-like protein [Piromyces finnis]|eukprot:ORX46023.1 Sec1-like protein [Piromyces finnis]
MIRQVNSSSKILIVDYYTHDIIFSIFSRSELANENVELIYRIDRKDSFPTYDAIYFISPTDESIQFVVNDFRNKNMYSTANIFFTNTVTDDLIGKLKIISNSVEILKELYVDFFVFESRVFTIRSEECFQRLYNSKLQNNTLEDISNKVVSLLATLGDYPDIRYFDPDGNTSNIASKFAYKLQEKLDNLTDIDGDFPKKTPYKRTNMIIVDRSYDLVGPLLHDFYYQGMANDIADIEDGVIYRYTMSNGTNKQEKLNENEDFWRDIRHMYISDAMEYVKEKVDECTKFAQNNEEGVSLNKLKMQTYEIPKQLMIKDKATMHQKLIEECMDYYTAQKEINRDVATIEQDLADESFVDNKLLSQIRTFVQDRNLNSREKMQLIMLYVLCSKSIMKSTISNLCSDAAIDEQKIYDLLDVEKQNNNVTISDDIINIKSTEFKSYLAEKRKKLSKNQRYEISDLSRYITPIKILIRDIIKEKTKQKFFKHTNLAIANETLNEIKKPKSHKVLYDDVSLQNYKPTWARRTNDKNIYDLRTYGARIIIFILGGMTYAEMREVYDMVKEHNRDIIIGSTGILTPKSFMDDIYILKTDIKSRNTVQLRKKLVRSYTVGKTKETYREKRLKEKGKLN